MVQSHGGRIELLEVESRLFGILQSHDDFAGRRIEFDAFCVRIPSAVDKLFVPFGSDFHVVESGVIAAHITMDDFALGREDIDSLIGAGVDVASFVDNDGAVSWADRRLTIWA